VSVADWGMACLLFWLLMVGCGAICGRLWLGVGGGALLAGADFGRGLVAHGTGYSVPAWWGSYSVSGWVGLRLLLASVYLVWGFYPFVLVAVSAKWRTFVAILVVILIAALTAWRWPIEPPWMAGHVRAADAVSFYRTLVGGDVSSAAAFPSVHVAVPVAVALCESGWKREGAWWCAIITAVVVVLGGEHWIVDVLAGALLALAVVLSGSICGAYVGRGCSALSVRWVKLWPMGRGLLLHDDG
jgi:hypothetical protein